MKWCTRIERFEIDEVFVDTQIRGPYRLWHHTHTFEDQGDGTIMRDIVVYRLPFGILGTIVHALFVRRTLESIFQYRYDALAQLMGGQA
jgi:ligand-binding SRPBCC domain-containing protein